MQPPLSRPTSAHAPSLGATLRALRLARARGDAATLRREGQALARATRRLDGLFTSLGIWGADVEDLRQETHLRVLEHLEESDEVEHALGWLRTIARRLALDFLRKRQRQRTRPCDPAALAELGGGCAPDAPFEKEAEERELAAHRAQARAWLEAYVARADAARAPRGHQVRAWFLRHVEGRSIPEIRAWFAARRAPASADAASKWIERGGALVRELAYGDEDATRGAAFLRALEG